MAAIGIHARPPEAQQEEVPITLTLIAAPDEPAAPEVVKSIVPPAPVQPAPTRLVGPEPVKPIPPVASIEEPVIPEPVVVPQSKPNLPAEPAKPVIVVAAQPTLKIVFQGDSSSINPGKDATTTTAQPGVKAKPNYLKNPEPLYPSLAKRRHQEGVVILNVTVTKEGRAANVRLKESSHFPLLDEAALEAVRDWSFEPCRIGSEPVDSEIEVPVRFQLAK